MSSALAPLDVGRPDVLPGYILSKPRLSDYGMIEDQFTRRYYHAILTDAATLPEEVRGLVVAQVLAEIRKRPLAFGRPDFDIAAFHPSNLTLLLYACLRVKHPQVTIDGAAALVTEENNPAVRKAVLECWGYNLDPKEPDSKNDGGQTGETGSPGTGEPPAKPSLSEASPSTPSPA